MNFSGYLEDRLVLTAVSEAATKITLHLDAEKADLLVAQAEARAVRNRNRAKN